MGLISGIMGNAGPIDPASANQEYGKLLGNGEQIYAAFMLVRDAMLFSNRRLIMIDKQGISGRRTSYHSIPYRSISHFSVETAGHLDLDAELYIWIGSDPAPLKQKFNRQVDIYEVQGLLSHFVAA